MSRLPIYSTEQQKMKINLSPKFVWLELEDFDEARDISKDNFSQCGKSSQWQLYINALARLGFIKYVKERNPNIKTKSENNKNPIDDICYLSLDKFRVCLIILDNLIDNFVIVPEKLITSAKTAAHFYVLLEVLKEEEQLNIHGFLRYGELFKYSQTPDFKFQPDGSYQLPLSLFDKDLHNLLVYIRFLSPSAIKLPVSATSLNTVLGKTITQTKTKAGKALVNLGKWWDEVFEEGWQSTEYIRSKIQNNLTWGYVRSRKESNRFSISRTKLFDFGLLLQNQTLALVVNLKKEENAEQGVLVQILPCQEEHLPSGLELKVTLNPNTPDSISQEVTAREADNAIQLEFTEALDKQFKVEVSYQDAVLTEEFIL